MEVPDGATLVSSIAHGPGANDIAVVSTKYSGGDFRSFEGKVHRAAKDASVVISDGNRKVEVRIGHAGSFAAADLNQDLTGWNRSQLTPGVGTHTLTARSVQGNTVRATATSTFNVTA